LARFEWSIVFISDGVKEAQTLARHASPELTMNVYGVARDDRLAEAVKRVAQAIKLAEIVLSGVGRAGEITPALKAMVRVYY